MITERFDKNNYEFNKESKIGVYLIHGFSSTTYEMKMLADFLASKNMHVVAKNLPGHGTTVEDCNRVKFHDWLDFSKQELAVLASKSEQIFIVGCSMGGLIALYLASMFPVNGVIVGGLVMKFKKPFMTNIVNTVLCKFLKTREKKMIFDPNVRDKIDFYGYSHYPLVALNEFRKMIKFITPKLKKIELPVLLIHSNKDRTSIKDNVLIAKQIIPSKESEIFVVEEAHHNLFDLNPDQKTIFKKLLSFINQHRG